jgi:hypothetical protein
VALFDIRCHVLQKYYPKIAVKLMCAKQNQDLTLEVLDLKWDYGMSTLTTQLSNLGTTKQVLTLVSPSFMYGHNVRLGIYDKHCLASKVLCHVPYLK